MLETIRAMGLNTWQASHAGWKLLGYIDWLEDKLDSVWPNWRENNGEA